MEGEAEQLLVVRVMGGLGNQMFQFAAGWSISNRLNRKLLLDCGALKAQPSSAHARKFSLNCFDLQPVLAEEAVLKRFGVFDEFNWLGRIKNKAIKYCPSRLSKVIGKIKPLNEDLIKIKGAEYFRNESGPLYFYGYWQSEDYFAPHKQYISRLFQIKRDKPAEVFKFDDLIFQKGLRSVALHVRRGDYVSQSAVQAIHGVNLESYYQRAISAIKAQIPGAFFFVFSDDVAWAKEHYTGPAYSIVDHGQADFWDLYLMSKCAHNIIANSSFSWWGAWLNESKDKLIFAPGEWYRGVATSSMRLIPEKWQII